MNSIYHMTWHTWSTKHATNFHSQATIQWNKKQIILKKEETILKEIIKAYHYTTRIDKNVN